MPLLLMRSIVSFSSEMVMYGLQILTGKMLGRLPSQERMLHQLSHRMENGFYTTQAQMSALVLGVFTWFLLRGESHKGFRYKVWREENTPISLLTAGSLPTSTAEAMC